MSGVSGKKPFDPFEFETRLPLFRRLGASPWAETFANSDLPAFQLYADEVQIICQWAKTTNIWSAPRLLRSLVMEKIDDTERGRRAREAQRRLGLLDIFPEALLLLLTERVGADKLEGFHFHYNGHMTRAMFPLFQILQGIGLSDGSATRSEQSGTYPVQGMMNFLLDGKKMRPRDAEACFMGGEIKEEHVGPPKGMSAHDWMKKCALDAIAAGQTFVVDKGSTLLVDGEFPEELLPAIREGKIRFLVHNTDDLTALKPHLDYIWAVDIAGSLLKMLEAHVIGEQYALLAAREVRKNYGERIAEVDQYVVGFGLLGHAIAEALARFAMPEGTDPKEIEKYRKHVVVVEKDPERRKQAEAAGFTAVAPGERADQAKRGVAIVATSGGGIGAENAGDFSDETLVLSLTTGGKGVDRSSLEEAAGPPRVLREREGAIGNDKKRERKTFADLKYDFDDRSLIVVNGGYALNLFEESWSDRFAVTAAAVIMAVIAAADIEGPGLHDVPEDELVKIILVLYERAGLLKPRPLDSDDPNERAALEEDLRAFIRRTPR